MEALNVESVLGFLVECALLEREWVLVQIHVCLHRIFFLNSLKIDQTKKIATENHKNWLSILATLLNHSLSQCLRVQNDWTEPKL